MAEVENQATRQQVEVARQDYANALTDLHNQIGTPETAGTAEPLGEFVLPYEAVRTASSPDRALTEFIDSTYEQAATLARWDRAALERSTSISGR